MSDSPLDTLELMETVMKKLSSPPLSTEGGFKRVGGLRDLNSVLETLQQCAEEEGEEWQAGDEEVLALLESTLQAEQQPIPATEETFNPNWPQPGQVDDETYLQEIGPESSYPIVSEEAEAELSPEAVQVIESRREYYRCQPPAPSFRS